MKLSCLEMKRLEIPFRVSFKHSSAERSATEAVIAIVSCENDLRGYGEGCPRSYVTGESIESCLSFAKEFKNEILEINSIDALREFISKNRVAIDKAPAAWSAIEIALLDWMGKAQRESVEEVVGLPMVKGVFQYTAVLGASKPDVFQAQLAQYVKIGFSDFKIKISGDSTADLSSLRAIREALPEARIRLDANNLWSDVVEANTYLAPLASYCWAIEEPLKAYDYSGLTRLAKQLGCKIILDESFLRIEDFANLSENPELWIPNIRISKMGGLLRSLLVAEKCKADGVGFIIGAQVGETSILTRAALTLANTYRDMLIAQEGAYGTYLLERDIVNTPIMFGKNGSVHLDASHEMGLGLDVSLFDINVKC